MANATKTKMRHNIIQFTFTDLHLAHTFQQTLPFKPNDPNTVHVRDSALKCAIPESCALFNINLIYLWSKRMPPSKIWDTQEKILMGL